MFRRVTWERDGALEEGLIHIDDLTERVRLLAHGGRLTFEDGLRAIDIRDEDFDVRDLEPAWDNVPKLIQRIRQEEVLQWLR